MNGTRKSPNALGDRYDFIVCGAGSSGSVVASRLSENPEVSVLLLEAGSNDDVPEVMEPGLWQQNLGSARDWGFASAPERHLNGRRLPLSMGKVLGGGSSINVMVWARGHQSDWDFYAAETGDPAWSYDAVLQIYKQIENWQGRPDVERRGVGGPVFIQQPSSSHPLASATLEAAQTVGLPVFPNPNGLMMEGHGGATRYELIIREGRRQSIYRAYLSEAHQRPNLTVLTDARVHRVLLENATAVGVELEHAGSLKQVTASCEVVLSLGAFETPRVLMQSGIGDAEHLQRMGLRALQHLPGVGQNLQDHINFGCIWEYSKPLAPQGNGAEMTVYWQSDPSLPSPDLLLGQAEVPLPSAQTKTDDIPDHGWTMFAGVCRPQSRGTVQLTGPKVDDPLEIRTNALSEPADRKAAIAAVELSRDIGNSVPLRSMTRREVLPGPRWQKDPELFLRDAGVTYWHETCTARMGRDELSVVDGSLAVYGVKQLRVADGSVFPRIPTGNTMAPCVVVGERAAAMLKRSHGL